MKPATVLVDVREDIRKGREPFSKIMAAVSSLGPDQKLLLVAPFEPTPLIQILANQGFQYETRTMESGDSEVLFSRRSMRKVRKTNKLNPGEDPTVAPTPSHQVLDVDARGLEPPLPMMKILEAVASLPDGAELRSRTDRRPMHLYPQLEERGFTAQTEEQSDGSFVTHIRRN